MFYDFNKHKRQAATSPPVEMNDLGEKFRQRSNAARKRLSDQMGRSVSCLPIQLQKAVFLTLAGIGVVYCICLILPNSFLRSIDHTVPGILRSHETIQAATPSPKQQAFEQYLDSLERAFVADSIFQSQQTTEDHAENSIHP